MRVSTICKRRPTRLALRHRLSALCCRCKWHDRNRIRCHNPNRGSTHLPPAASKACCLPSGPGLSQTSATSLEQTTPRVAHVSVPWAAAWMLSGGLAGFEARRPVGVQLRAAAVASVRAGRPLAMHNVTGRWREAPNGRTVAYEPGTTIDAAVNIMLVEGVPTS